MGLPAYILDRFPPEIREGMNLAIDWLHEHGVQREDFHQLKDSVADLSGTVADLSGTVSDLSAAVADLTGTVAQLATAQNKTEARLEELATAQNKTEARLEELATAQNKTEARLEELATAQREMTTAMMAGDKRLYDTISALGSRWGIQSEETFRAALAKLLADAGYAVNKGYFGNREVDVVIKNGIHVLLEITSALRKEDIAKLNESARDYEAKTGIAPTLKLAAIYVSPTAMRAVLESPRRIELLNVDE